MSLTDIEQHVLAYWIASGQARELNIATRYYPHGELIMILTDKIQVETRKFGRKANAGSRAAATAFVDRMIEAGGWSTTKNDFGGTMHQFQLDQYRKTLKDWQASDPIVQAAAAGGDTWWADKFAELTA